MIRTIYFLFILFSCADIQQGVEVISAERLIDLKDQGVKVFDIRTRNEYNQGHIPGVIHVDFLGENFLEQMKKYDASEPVVIHCASGGRSGKASKLLQDAGFKMIYDYSGGFSDWQSKGLEVE